MNKPVAIITGASRGIGRDCALTLAKRGYDCVLVSRTLTDLTKLKHEIETKYPVKANVFAIDVANVKQVSETVTQVYEIHQRIDLLFNNAGVLLEGTSTINPENLKTLMEVNIWGAYYFIYYVVPHMKEKKSGYIINVASRAAKDPLPEFGGYALTKFAIRGYTEALFKELAPFNIKVTALHPGLVNTKMTERFPDILPEDKIQVCDISKTLNYLLDLENSACIKEIEIYAKKFISSNFLDNVK